MASSIVKITLCIYLLDVACGARFDDVSVLTVATDTTHGLQRLQRSAQVNGFSIEVLGLNEKWTGGDMKLPGGGQKIKFLRNKLYELQKTKSGDHIVIFTDGYDVLFLDGIENIIKRFKEMEDTRVLFSAEPFCWPDWALAKNYPTTAHNSPYLNSGLFMGYLNELYELVSNKPIKDTDDDQLYYTMAFIDENIRTKLKISLDYSSRIFQNLQGLTSDIELNLNGSVEWPYIVNKLTNEKPLVVHGNGMTKLILNNYGNYLAKAWSPRHGCKMCQENKITLDENKLPNVFLSLFIEQPTPFMEEFFISVKALDYPKSKINLLIRNNVPFHEEMVAKFVADNGPEYAVVKRIKPEDQMTEAESRKVAMDRCVNGACDYFFSLDSVARVKPSTLKYLLSSGYDVISPMLLRPGHAWSNFWGAINANGFYARSHDYMDIVGSDVIGIWNVPFITSAYLIKSTILRHPDAKTISFHKQDTDPDMVFCASLRDLGVFMHVSNEEDFGHLVNPDSFDASRTHPDMYQVIDNKVDWEARYLNEDFHKNFEEGRNHSMPCPDVYWFPVMNMRFCKEWIEIMEVFGGWSDGTHSDNRLEGGYEAVPTRDIHMTQVGLDIQWLHILKEYVRPLQEMVFLGYYHNPPRSLMNFVVRYRPEEQPSLRPHHDSSTYTINLALNTAKEDYEGGGCRFIRYNCSVRDTKPGWLLMHPGRLTHFHEGLLVTKGTRYIMISFVDP